MAHYCVTGTLKISSGAGWLAWLFFHTHLRYNFILAHSIYTQNELNRIIFAFVFGAIIKLNRTHSSAATTDAAAAAVVPLFFQPPRPMCACVLHFNYMSDKIRRQMKKNAMLSLSARVNESNILQDEQ